MGIYYFIFIISYIFCLFDFIKESKIKLFVYTLFTVSVALIAGLRAVGVDNDSVVYQQILLSTENVSFFQIIKGDYWENIERGYFFLNKVILSLGGDINVLLLVVALATSLLNYTIIYKISPYPFLSLLFYLSFFYLYRDFTQIRYGLSCALAFYSVYFLIKKEKLLFCFFLILSVLFHNTSYVLILILPFCFFVKNKFIYFFLPILGFIGFFYNFLPLLLSQGIAMEHMEIYLQEEGGAGLMIPFIGLIIMLLYIFNEKELLKSSLNRKYYEIFFRLFSISVTLNFLFFHISIFQRFSYLLFQFGIFLLPMMLYDLKASRYKIYFKFGYFMFTCFFLYYGIKMINPALIRPYFN